MQNYNYQYSSQDFDYEIPAHDSQQKQQIDETQKGQPLKGYKQFQQKQSDDDYRDNQKNQSYYQHDQSNYQQRNKDSKQFGSDQNKYRNGYNKEPQWKQHQMKNKFHNRNPYYDSDYDRSQQNSYIYQNNYKQEETKDDYKQFQKNLNDKSIISKNYEELEKKHNIEDFMDLNKVQANTYKFQTQFLRAKNYEDIQELRKYFSPLKYLNLGHFPRENDVFVLIRPKAGHYNIHKAIKYGIWTSFTRQNKQLSQFYNDSSRDVYLIFLPLHGQNYKSKIIGIAQMISEYNEDRTYKFWDKDEIYIGSFQIMWHYIKDVYTDGIGPLTYYYKNQQQQCDLDELKEGAQLSFSDALNIFQIFADTPDSPSVFKQFNGLDIQEDKQRYFKQTGRYEDVQHPPTTTKKQYLY